MHDTKRGVALGILASVVVAAPLWAHPGHLTHGDGWSTLRHLVWSPYHLAVLGAVLALCVAAWLSLRAAPVARRRREAEDPPA